MKTKAQKQKDLEALTEQFKNAKAAMVVGFQKMTVAKDQELRNQLREAGVSYEVVKNTLARRASEGTALGARGRTLQRCDCGRAEQRRSSRFVKSDFKVYEGESGNFYVQGRSRRRQGRCSERRGSDREFAVEGRVDFKGDVPNQLPGATFGHGYFRRAAQPGSRYQTDW